MNLKNCKKSFHKPNSLACSLAAAAALQIQSSGGIHSVKNIKSIAKEAVPGRYFVKKLVVK